MVIVEKEPSFGLYCYVVNNRKVVRSYLNQQAEEPYLAELCLNNYFSNLYSYKANYQILYRLQELGFDTIVFDNSTVYIDLIIDEDLHQQRTEYLRKRTYACQKNLIILQICTKRCVYCNVNMPH
jgi:hypothetical protein